jgi:hypothetical protein
MHGANQHIRHVNQTQRHREEHFVDIRAPPRHPDHPNGCSPLLRLFLCFMCASGCMVCGVVIATATLAPLTLLTPSNIQLARANTANVRDIVNALVDTPSPPNPPPHPPTTPLQTFLLLRSKFKRASDAKSRSELWKAVPEWFDAHTGGFNAVDAAIDISRYLILSANQSFVTYV